MGSAGNELSEVIVTVRISSGGFSFGTRGAMKMKAEIRVGSQRFMKEHDMEHSMVLI